MARYNFRAVEKKWQEIWENEEIFKTRNDFTKPKFYALVEFPYPGEGCMWDIPGPTQLWMWWPASGAWRVTMSSTPWAGMPLGCPQKLCNSN